MRAPHPRQSGAHNHDARSSPCAHPSDAACGSSQQCGARQPRSSDQQLPPCSPVRSPEDPACLRLAWPGRDAEQLIDANAPALRLGVGGEQPPNQ